ncbi:MAG: L-histidine N(alpha)-methyltransferase [Gammaproteobacteria bacterium]|nr:L-histidine N(alpha)-methyltransferase [Gammaproteobacteria bacterium]
MPPACPQTAATPQPDATPDRRRFAADVRAGLSATPKRLPSKYFYDERGSAQFDAICELPEYYLTRTEISIMRAHAGEMARELGPKLLLVELGSGSSVKTPLLLDHLPDAAGYVPVDISREHLQRSAAGLDRRYPGLSVRPVAADFTQSFTLPATDPAPARVAVFFPGSTIGNFEPTPAQALLRRMRTLAGDNGRLLIGVDLAKDRATLEAAYNDAAGVTAAFNLNLLARINRELGADFDLGAFEHRAHFDAAHSRIEMHLAARCAQRVHVCGQCFDFEAGETIHTENSYKHSAEDFARLAAGAGWRALRDWRDAHGWFAVMLFASGV